MGQTSPLTRALVRLRGGRSEDDRDVRRDLRRTLKKAGDRDGQPVQAAGRPMAADEYVRWRKRALRRGAVSSAPELGPGRYALVLFTFAPASAQQFVSHGAAAHLAPPTVGMFRPLTEPALALAARRVDRAVSAAGVPRAAAAAHRGRWRVADLELDWPLPPYRDPPLSTPTSPAHRSRGRSPHSSSAASERERPTPSSSSARACTPRSTSAPAIVSSACALTETPARSIAGVSAHKRVCQRNAPRSKRRSPASR